MEKAASRILSSFESVHEFLNSTLPRLRYLISSKFPFLARS